MRKGWFVLFRLYGPLKDYSSDPESLGKYEFELIEDCMIQKGYRLVAERKLYVRVKRETPDLDTYWMIHGTAGLLEQKE